MLWGCMMHDGPPRHDDDSDVAGLERDLVAHVRDQECNHAKGQST